MGRFQTIGRPGPVAKSPRNYAGISFFEADPLDSNDRYFLITDKSKGGDLKIDFSSIQGIYIGLCGITGLPHPSVSNDNIAINLFWDYSSSPSDSTGRNFGDIPAGGSPLTGSYDFGKILPIDSNHPNAPANSAGQLVSVQLTYTCSMARPYDYIKDLSATGYYL